MTKLRVDLLTLARVSGLVSSFVARPVLNLAQSLVLAVFSRTAPRRVTMGDGKILSSPHRHRHFIEYSHYVNIT